MTKYTHFFPVKSTYSVEDYARIYIDNIASLHGVPFSIISDRGAQFTSRFWRSFQRGLGTQVMLSTTFHPEMDGQVESTIQTLKDMFKACIINFKVNWDEHSPLVEFSYNNSFHSSISMVLMNLCMVGGVGILFGGLRLGVFASWSQFDL